MKTYYSHFQFVCRVLSKRWTSPELERLRNTLQGGVIDWETVVEIVNDYFVAPAFWGSLLEKGLRDAVPSMPSRYFSEIYRLNRERNRQLRRQLLEAVSLLQHAGVPTLLLKGAGQLVQPIHPDLGYRIIGDLDLLIDPDQFNQAAAVLMGQGYQIEAVPYDTRRLHHFAPLFRSGDYGSIELHRHAVHLKALPALPTAAVWKDARIRKISGLNLMLPSATHAVLINFLHSQVADRNHALCQFNLRALLDFAALQSNHDCGDIDWEAIYNVLKSQKLLSAWAAYGLSAYRLLNSSHCDQNSPIGPTVSFQYTACLAAVRWPLADAALRRLHEFSPERIQKRYGGEATENVLSLAAYRMLYLYHYLQECFQQNR